MKWHTIWVRAAKSWYQCVASPASPIILPTSAEGQRIDRKGRTTEAPSQSAYQRSNGANEGPSGNEGMKRIKSERIREIWFISSL
jgi:hypothetical protein